MLPRADAPFDTRARSRCDHPDASERSGSSVPSRRYAPFAHGFHHGGRFAEEVMALHAFVNPPLTSRAEALDIAGRERGYAIGCKVPVSLLLHGANASFSAAQPLRKVKRPARCSHRAGFRSTKVDTSCFLS